MTDTIAITIPDSPKPQKPLSKRKAQAIAKAERKLAYALEGLADRQRYVDQRRAELQLLLDAVKK